MYRKLNNSLIAFSASALVLVAIALFAPPSATSGGGATGSLDAAAEDGVDAGTAARKRRGLAGGRRGLALPYFSFARGVRRIGG